MSAVLIVVACIACNAALAALEIGFVSASKADIRAHAATGDVRVGHHKRSQRMFLAAGQQDWRTLVRPAVTVGPEDALLGVLRLLQTRRSHMGIVIDREPPAQSSTSGEV